MAYDFKITSEVMPNGRTAYHAQLNGSADKKFVVGYRTFYLDNFGLYHNRPQKDLVYSGSDYHNDFGFWSHFIEPTAQAESKGSYLCLNTYDRAKFTFTFMQFAAHVPNGDFVVFLKRLLNLPKAADYFPRLTIKDGRIHYRNNATLTPLESNDSTKGLMNYFNPSLDAVDDQEVICAARMIHWASSEADHRRTQVETAIELMKHNMKEYSRRFALDGVPAKVCLMVCDIRHQGRGKNDRIAHALNTNGDYDKAFENLCTIGEVNYKSRIDTVRSTLKKLLNDGAFHKKYEKASNSFVDL